MANNNPRPIFNRAGPTTHGPEKAGPAHSTGNAKHIAKADMYKDETEQDRTGKDGT